MMVIAGCGESAPCAPSAAAYDGFRWSCARAPPCATFIDCADPSWRQAGASQLDALSQCLLERCEVRAACMSEAVEVCEDSTVPS